MLLAVLAVPLAAAGTAAAAAGSIDLCASVAYDAGYRSERLVTAVAVAMAESTCNPVAQGTNGPSSGCPRGSVDRGLWQLNSCYQYEVSNSCAYDAACNARETYRISAGGTIWQQWASYTNGRHVTWLDEARTAVAGLAPLKEAFAFGSAPDSGSTADVNLAEPLVGMASTNSGHGYWLLAGDGGIFTYGDAEFFGSTGSMRLEQPVVGMAANPAGSGYWVVAADGGIFTFGDAPYLGSAAGTVLNRPVVGMSATPSGNGYSLVTSDGGIFTFGDAGFFGSAGDVALRRPVVGMAATPTGKGYWAVAADGGIFTYGDAPFLGSMGGAPLVSPVVGLAATPSGTGYRMVAGDGGVFCFGDGRYLGRPDPALLRAGRAAGISTSPAGEGYWVAAAGAA